MIPYSKKSYRKEMLLIVVLCAAVFAILSSGSQTKTETFNGLEARFSDSDVVLTNLTARELRVVIELNGRWKSKAVLHTGQNRFNTSQFYRDDGTRFDWVTTKLFKLRVYDEDFAWGLVWEK